MGIYLNPHETGFQDLLNSEPYVDKTELITYTNRVVNTLQRYVCVTRPRRFGKTATAKMLASYYCNSCDSKKQFQDLKIAKDPSFEKHLNQHNVFFWHMSDFVIQSGDTNDVVDCLEKNILEELRAVYGDYIDPEEIHLPNALKKLYSRTKEEFIFIIDGWDSIFRRKPQAVEAQTKYLSFLTSLLKDQPYVELVYMTGILPVKKLRGFSSLSPNMFDEYTLTMPNPAPIAECCGFTEDEVKGLCQQYDVDFIEMQHWYGGYWLKEDLNIYNPHAVVRCLMHKQFDVYWTKTETYEALKKYIDMDYDGLKECAAQMLDGGKCVINTRRFLNDMVTLHDKGDVLTLLVHLGYLTFNLDTQEVYIPNKDVRQSFLQAM